jgi:hypothetical protein
VPEPIDTPEGWDDAFSAPAGRNDGEGRLEQLLAELAGDPGIADALGDLEAAAAPRFRATFTKLNAGVEFSAAELSAVLDLARYSLEELGQMDVVSTEQTNDSTWVVTYAVTAPGPMAEMMAAPVDGVMAAWRGRMPIPQVGLIAAEGEWVG